MNGLETKNQKQLLKELTFPATVISPSTNCNRSYPFASKDLLESVQILLCIQIIHTSTRAHTMQRHERKKDGKNKQLSQIHSRLWLKCVDCYSILIIEITGIRGNLWERFQQKEIGKSKTRFRDIPLDPGTVSMYRRKQDKLTTTRGDGRSVNGASESYDVITPATCHGLQAMSSHRHMQRWPRTKWNTN